MRLLLLLLSRNPGTGRCQSRDSGLENSTGIRDPGIAIFSQECCLVPVFSCGRSLYIDWRMMVVVGGECPTPCKREGEMSGGICLRGEMSYTQRGCRCLICCVC